VTRGRLIVGICLVRNEERFLDQVLANIIDFCDQIIIADNESADATNAIAKYWSDKYPSVSVKIINHPAESHQMLLPYINTSTWIFAVDGDEIYDPVGLAQLRTQIMAGSFDGYWRILGNVLNCISLDRETNQAHGYLSPPSRSITKLYNFNAIDDWSGVEGERLHGGTISFKEGFQDSTCLRLHEKVLWDNSIFRCLHLCFMPRSSMDSKPKNGIVTRWNLAEQQSKGVLVFFFAWFFRLLGISRSSEWKFRKYGRGPVAAKNVEQFIQRSFE